MRKHTAATHFLIVIIIIICCLQVGCKKDPIPLDSTFIVYNTSNSGLPFNDVRNIISDWDNNIWLSPCCGGLSRFDGTQWTTYTTSNSPLPADQINSLACDKNNKIWIGTTNGLFSLDNGQWSTIDFPSSLLDYHEVLSLTTDSSNALWAIMGDYFVCQLLNDSSESGNET